MGKHKPVNVDTKKHRRVNIRFVETLLSEGIAILIRHGESPNNANELSHKFVIEVHRQLAGALMYLGKNTALDTQMRHWAIKEDFHNGETIEQLALKHSLGTRQIYTIVSRKIDLIPAKSDTTAAVTIAILATRMFMKAGIDRDDAVCASRGLLAVVSAKLGGTAPYIANTRFVEGIIKQIEIVRLHKAGKSIGCLSTHFGLKPEEVRDIIKNHPVATMPDSSEFPIIRTRLFSMAASFSGYSEINSLLESATENISRAEEIIKKIEGEHR